MGISDALAEVRDMIEGAARGSGRTPEDIKLIAVTKTVGAGRILEAVREGVSILGENRVQEARDKIAEIGSITAGQSVQWHLIGTLQKNKAKLAVELFDLIQTVDSAALADEINKYASRAGKRQRVLIQVKLSEEATKHGVSEEKLADLIATVKAMDNLSLEGLMTIPPFFENPEGTRSYFRRLRRLRDDLLGEEYELSMGMSNDFRVAIEEGATMVRIGTAIFGERIIH
jgi:hypothetical protein